MKYLFVLPKKTKKENEERTFLQQTTDRHNKHASRELEDSTHKQKWDKGSHRIHPNSECLEFFARSFSHFSQIAHSSFNKRAHKILIYFKANLLNSHRSLARSAANSLFILIRILTRLSAVSVRIVNLFLEYQGEWSDRSFKGAPRDDFDRASVRSTVQTLQKKYQSWFLKIEVTFSQSLSQKRFFLCCSPLWVALTHSQEFFPKYKVVSFNSFLSGNWVDVGSNKEEKGGGGEKSEKFKSCSNRKFTNRNFTIHLEAYSIVHTRERGKAILV